MNLAAAIALSLFSLSLSDVVRLFSRDTNAEAATRKGTIQYQRKHYDQALQAFRKAHSLRQTPRSGFNVATAEIAAGQLEQGSSDMAAALRDPSLRADALYNRANSALAAKSFDAAIRDYSGSLRIRPSSAAAKRNLEIALNRKAEQEKQQQQQSGGGGKQGQRGEQKPAPGNAPKNAPHEPDAETPRKSDRADVDALLRSIQQQENEELSRMRKTRPEPRKIGW